jgi:hypothetical protein
MRRKLGKRGTAPGIVQKRFDNAGHLRRALGGIDRTELRGTLAMVRAGPENVLVPVALGADDVTHREGQSKLPGRSSSDFACQRLCVRELCRVSYRDDIFPHEWDCDGHHRSYGRRVRSAIADWDRRRWNMMHFEQIVCQYLYNLSIIAENALTGSGEDSRSSRSKW